MNNNTAPERRIRADNNYSNRTITNENRSTGALFPTLWRLLPSSEFASAPPRCLSWTFVHRNTRSWILRNQPEENPFTTASSILFNYDQTVNTVLWESFNCWTKLRKTSRLKLAYFSADFARYLLAIDWNTTAITWLHTVNVWKKRQWKHRWRADWYIYQNLHPNNNSGMFIRCSHIFSNRWHNNALTRSLSAERGVCRLCLCAGGCRGRGRSERSKEGVQRRFTTSQILNC